MDGGKKLLARCATTPQEQAKARAAVNRTLELAEGMQSLYVRRGIRQAPGCWEPGPPRYLDLPLPLC